MAGGTGKAYASAQTEIGLAIETTKGTAVTPPKFWIPVKAPKYKPNQMEIPDETIQGSMVAIYDLVTGMRDDQHGWDSYPYLDSFPVFVRCELGSSDTLTTAATATKLKTATIVGATSIKTTAKLTAGDWITIGTGSTIETHKVTAVTGTVAPYVATLNTQLVYAHAATTTVGGLTGHSFSLLNNGGAGNQPPSVTLVDYDGERTRQMTAMQLDELTIKGTATGLTTYTCTWFGNPATKITKPSTSYSLVQAPPGWTFAAKLGTTTVQTVVDWEFDFKRGVKPIPALTGTKEYFEYFANTLQATGKLTIIEQATSPYLTDYENGTELAYTFTFYDVSKGWACNFHSTKAKFKSGSLDRSKEWVEVPLTFQLLPSATDATAGGVSPVKMTVANATSTSY